MVTITVPNDDEFLARLRSVDGPVQLRTESGVNLGKFIPNLPSRAQLEADGCPYSDEELSQMFEQTGGRPLSEILEDLQRE